LPFDRVGEHPKGLTLSTALWVPGTAQALTLSRPGGR
jgi:hypothetical protein